MGWIFSNGEILLRSVEQAQHVLANLVSARSWIVWLGIRFGSSIYHRRVCHFLEACTCWGLSNTQLHILGLSSSCKIAHCVESLSEFLLYGYILCCFADVLIRWRKRGHTWIINLSYYLSTLMVSSQLPGIYGCVRLVPSFSSSFLSAPELSLYFGNPLVSLDRIYGPLSLLWSVVWFSI